MLKTDVLIIGGGPGGAATAMFLLRHYADHSGRGRISALPHRESRTGESAQVLRRLGLEDEMVKREYPIKHGVKVYGSTAVR